MAYPEKCKESKICHRFLSRVCIMKLKMMQVTRFSEGTRWRNKSNGRVPASWIRDLTRGHAFDT